MRQILRVSGPESRSPILSAAVDALRELLALASSVWQSPNIVPSLSSCSVTERLAQRRGGVADAVGADVAGGVLPRQRRLRLGEQLLAGRREPQAHHAAVDVVLEALDQPAPVEQQQRLRNRALGEAEVVGERLRACWSSGWPC